MQWIYIHRYSRASRDIVASKWPLSFFDSSPPTQTVKAISDLSRNQSLQAYFETRTGLGLGHGLGLEENPDSRKTRTRTRKKIGLVFNKTRTWLLKTRTRNRQNRIQNKDSVYENAKVFWKGLIIVNMINDDLFITIISMNKFLECY
jgi:hypothetical protein